MRIDGDAAKLYSTNHIHHCREAEMNAILDDYDGNANWTTCVIYLQLPRHVVVAETKQLYAMGLVRHSP